MFQAEFVTVLSSGTTLMAPGGSRAAPAHSASVPAASDSGLHARQAHAVWLETGTVLEPHARGAFDQQSAPGAAGPPAGLFHARAPRHHRAMSSGDVRTSGGRRGEAASVPAIPPAARFAGFPPEALGFLRAVAFYQDRAWFAANRAIYESAVRAPFAALVTDLAAELARRGLPLTGDPAKALFRLHRDVRFSRDKSPFKTATGCVLTRDGTKKSPGLLYVHLDPAGCFLAAGFWQPAPAELEALRRHALAAPKAWAAMRARLAGSGLALDPAHAMKRLPRGFEDSAGSPAAEALRYRNFILRRPLAESDMASPGLVARAADFAAEAMPLLAWGWTALAKARKGR